MGLNPHGGDHQKPHGTIVDFSVNVHPLGYPLEINSMLEKEAGKLPYYPSIDGAEAAGILAQDLGLASEEIILGNGAVELIYLYARVHHKKTVCIIGPTFNEYERAFEKAGARVLHFNRSEEEGFQLSLNRFRDFLNEHPQCGTIVLCHPNNPTGDGLLDVQAFLDVVGERDILVDESFIEFTDLPSFIPWIHQANLLVLRSMTKFYALAGLRIGYACASKDEIQALMDQKEPWTMNAFALASVPVLMKASQYQKRVKGWIQTEKEFFFHELKKEKEWQVYWGHANFLLVQFPFSLGTVRDHLLTQGIYFRICTDFRELGENFGRFTVREKNEAILLIQKIKEAVYET